MTFGSLDSRLDRLVRPTESFPRRIPLAAFRFCTGPARYVLHVSYLGLFQGSFLNSGDLQVQKELVGSSGSRARALHGPEIRSREKSRGFLHSRNQLTPARCITREMTPRCGLRMTVSIFILSITTSGWSFSTDAPSATSTRKILHGIGASTLLATSFVPSALSIHFARGSISRY